MAVRGDADASCLRAPGHRLLRPSQRACTPGNLAAQLVGIHSSHLAHLGLHGAVPGPAEERRSTVAPDPVADDARGLLTDRRPRVSMAGNGLPPDVDHAPVPRRHACTAVAVGQAVSLAVAGQADSHAALA